MSKSAHAAFVTVLVQSAIFVFAPTPLWARQALASPDQRLTPEHRPSGGRKVVRKPLFDLESEALKARNGQTVPSSTPVEVRSEQAALTPPTFAPSAVALAVMARIDPPRSEPKASLEAVHGVPAGLSVGTPTPPLRPMVRREHSQEALTIVAPANPSVGLADWWGQAVPAGVQVDAVIVEGASDLAQWRRCGVDAAARWEPLTAGASIEGNIELRTGIGVKVVVRAGDTAEVHIGALSRVGFGKIVESDGHATLCIALARGKIEVVGLARDEFSLSRSPILVLSPEGRFPVRARTTAIRDAFSGRTTVEPLGESPAPAAAH